MPAPPPRLLDRVRWHLRVKYYSIRTEQAYTDWIRRYILFHHKRHPGEMGEIEIAALFSHLAINRAVAASTQNQALSALLFLYEQVLDCKLEFIAGMERVRCPARLPVVLTRAEARAILAQLAGDYRSSPLRQWLAAARSTAPARQGRRFRIPSIVVRRGKGQRDRVTLLPERLQNPLRAHLVRVRELHRQDLVRGHGKVICPGHLQ